MYQAGGAQGVTRALGLEPVVGDPAQPVVDHGEQSVHRAGTAVPKLEQEVGDLAIPGGSGLGTVHAACAVG